MIPNITFLFTRTLLTFLKLLSYNLLLCCLWFFFFLTFYWSIVDLYSLVLGVQQSESVIYKHILTLFQILFPYMPSESTE